MEKKTQWSQLKNGRTTPTKTTFGLDPTTNSVEFMTFVLGELTSQMLSWGQHTTRKRTSTFQVVHSCW